MPTSEIDAIWTLSNMLYAVAAAMLMLTALFFVAGFALGKKVEQANIRYNISAITAAVTVLFGAAAAFIEHLPVDVMGPPTLAAIFWAVIALITLVMLFMALFKFEL
jgi:uncharacterized membrane protein